MLTKHERNLVVSKLKPTSCGVQQSAVLWHNARWRVYLPFNENIQTRHAQSNGMSLWATIAPLSWSYSPFTLPLQIALV